MSLEIKKCIEHLGQYGNAYLDCDFCRDTNKPFFVELEETYQGGFITRRRINGIEVDIPPIPSDAIVTHRYFLTREDFKNKFGEYPVD